MSCIVQQISSGHLREDTTHYERHFDPLVWCYSLGNYIYIAVAIV